MNAAIRTNRPDRSVKKGCDNLFLFQEGKSFTKSNPRVACHSFLICSEILWKAEGSSA